MPLHTLSGLLGTTEELRALQKRTRRLLDLQTLYSRSVPPQLCRMSRVKGYKAGTLLIAAENAAAAAKLRQLAPTMLSSIRKIDAEVRAMRIDVQVTGAQHAY